MSGGGKAAQLPFVFLWRTHLAMSDESAPAKNVGQALSLYMSADGTDAHPAVYKLVKLTGLGERTVRRALKELRGEPESKGGPKRDQWLRTDNTKGGREESTHYDAALPSHIVNDGINHLHDRAFWEAYYSESHPNPATQAPFTDAVETVNAKPCHTGRETLPETTRNPATQAPRSSHEVSLEEAPYAIASQSQADSTPTRTKEEWNAIRDALIVVCRISRDELTRDGRGKLNKATSELSATPSASPELIKGFRKWYENTFTNATLTDMAVAAHWGEYMGSKGSTAGGKVKGQPWEMVHHATLGCDVRWWTDKHCYWTPHDYAVRNIPYHEDPYNKYCEKCLGYMYFDNERNAIPCPTCGRVGFVD